MSRVVEVVKEIICTYLGTGTTPDGIYAVWEIQRGNKQELLDHINALISIFTDAKKELEESLKNGSINNK